MADVQYYSPTGEKIHAVVENVQCLKAIVGLAEDGRPIYSADPAHIRWGTKKPLNVYVDERGQEWGFNQLTTAPHFTIKLTERERDAILAGLRVYLVHIVTGSTGLDPSLQRTIMDVAQNGRTDCWCHLDDDETEVLIHRLKELSHHG